MQTIGDQIESKQRQIRALRRDLAGINPKLSHCAVLKQRILRVEEEISALEASRPLQYATKN
ncbi:hypothetical protein A2Z56_02460 [Candidatus Kaiserbacteria bacterium RIFCSPHIGHO2_12_45_16]|nr:MAG: hypothetical protein A2Z56_02460 [Candidatus Kaiserbacteria bacterium RIFCSPHIGHO2_12_45_16]